VTVRTSTMEVLDEMKRDDRRNSNRKCTGKFWRLAAFPSASFESKEIIIQKLRRRFASRRRKGGPLVSRRYAIAFL
jgi:hypothetical protein